MFVLQSLSIWKLLDLTYIEVMKHARNGQTLRKKKATMVVGVSVQAFVFSYIRRCSLLTLQKAIFIKKSNTNCDYDCTARYEKLALAKICKCHV